MGCMNYFTPQPQSIIELYNLQEASNFVHVNPAIESHKILFISVYIFFCFLYTKIILLFYFPFNIFLGGWGWGWENRKKEILDPQLTTPTSSNLTNSPIPTHL